ncbi:hypothetical protein N431DRAFT_496815 [Stipitochalara longipes BDJ]|nr:hypothetical protein N431DRAFT_496815 [Stipitochalara longipes BDJ]
MSVSTSGFALRINGTCPVTDVDCGPTESPYRACCPADSFCPSEYNIECCPTSANCTEILLQNPQCANQSWNLYDNSGYFCYSFQSGEVLLPIISTGLAISKTTTSPSTSTSSTNTPSPTQSPASKKSNTGPIVGGVVGGIVVLAVAIAAIWFLLRRMRRKGSKKVEDHATHDELTEMQHTKDKGCKNPSELVSQHGVSELAEHQEGRPGELWDPHAVSELGG